MTLAEWLHNPHWLLMYCVSGWLLGWLAIRRRRWALLPGLYTVLLMMVGLSEGLGRVFPSLLGTALTAGLGLMALWGVSRLPALPLRVGLGTALVPPVVSLCFQMGFLLFLRVFQIP